MLDDLNNEASKISVLSFPAISAALPSRVNVNSYPHLHGLQLADNSSSQDSIDVLIGSDHSWKFVTDEIIRGWGWSYSDQKQVWMVAVWPYRIHYEFQTNRDKPRHIGKQQQLVQPRARSSRWYLETVLGNRVNWNQGKVRNYTVERWF